MLCSQCNKNNAVVFINKQDDKGNTSLEGLCYECAKKRGINPIDNLMKQANLSEADINNMTKQFTVATILNNHSKEIYAEVEKVKSKSDLPKVTNLIADILKKEDNIIRDKVAAKKCVEYLEIAQNKTIAAYTGTLVTYMGGGKI